MLGLRAIKVILGSGGGVPLTWPQSLYVGTDWIDLQMQAFCSRYGIYGTQPLCTQAPDELCRCGIYVCKTLNLLARYSLRAGCEATVIVDMWGKIVEHDNGYRAEYAKIMAFVVELGPLLVPVIAGDPLRLGAVEFVPSWLIRARAYPERHAKRLRTHDINAYTAADKWDLPVVTLEMALEIVEADHADWEAEANSDEAGAYTAIAYTS